MGKEMNFAAHAHNKGRILPFFSENPVLPGNPLAAPRTARAEPPAESESEAEERRA